MAKYTGPSCRLCRREGTKLFLKGDRCYTDKCAISRRSTNPGQHGQGRKKISEYGNQLREKQKAKRTYGIMEKQFRRYYRIAERTKGVTGENLLQILERRLDNVIFRMGFGGSRSQARQIVLHGHIYVNGRKVNIPSYSVEVGDVISIKERSKSSALFKENIEQKSAVPEWLKVDTEKMEGQVIALPTREDIDLPIEDRLIVELYSK
ncbi:MAG: 30S ribosomal protein S4 [Clostridia bacterium]|nr:30S ribosomal protein S4 [Clostridia bacterium]